VIHSSVSGVKVTIGFLLQMSLEPAPWRAEGRDVPHRGEHRLVEMGVPTPMKIGFQVQMLAALDERRSPRAASKEVR
jgi:hypothetical protein